VHRLFCGDCMGIIDGLDVLGHPVDTIFADPPDNIKQQYASYKDNLPDARYLLLLRRWIMACCGCANTIWFSYNARWSFEVGRIVSEMLGFFPGLQAKPCIQTFTFGQHSHHDLGNNYRPLLRLQWGGSHLYTDAIRVKSWRQEHGDKRADPRGRVPGDVFDYPRVTGNSKQRRDWHPTQLNEGLVERCLKLTTPPGGTVLDPFAGTGTTLRVCKRLGFDCTLIEIDKDYCRKIAAEHSLSTQDEIVYT
jgi:DNA modification methylase